MIQPLYIISSCSISPQQTYERAGFLAPVASNVNGQLYVQDPDYSRYISPVAIRRMSRMLKGGITAGMKCVEEAGNPALDAIIIGTARGSVTDMEQFIRDMILMKEEALTPTSFIQSTYNSVNGWLAMLTKCTNYNQTYVHRGFSIELALLDAQLLFAESVAPMYILAGGYDELTPEYVTIREKIGHFKAVSPSSLELLSHNDSSGTIAGEGAHFFTLSNNPGQAVCGIHALSMLQKPTPEIVKAAIGTMLAENNLQKEDIDVMVCGFNGDSRSNFLMLPLLEDCREQTSVVTFKHLCGEYDTASGFGLWLTDHLFRTNEIPNEVCYRHGASTKIKNIILFNVTIGCNVTLMLIKAV